MAGFLVASCMCGRMAGLGRAGAGCFLGWRGGESMATRLPGQRGASLGQRERQRINHDFSSHGMGGPEHIRQTARFRAGRAVAVCWSHEARVASADRHHVYECLVYTYARDMQPLTATTRRPGHGRRETHTGTPTVALLLLQLGASFFSRNGRITWPGPSFPKMPIQSNPPESNASRP